VRKLFEKYDLKLTFLSFILILLFYFSISFGIFYGLLYLAGYLLHFHVTIQMAFGIWILIALIRTFLFNERLS